MKDIRDKVVAITGASSGIGRSLALALADEGCHVAMADVNEEGLNETSEMLSGKEVKVHAYKLDVSNREQVYEWADRVYEKFNQVDVVINNAGVVVVDSLEQVTYEDFEWAFNILFWGVVYGTKAFLPYLRKRPEANIVNMSSINGIIPMPYNGPYNCAKFAVRAFNETLIQEFRGSSIHITSVHPGGIKTNLVRNHRFRRYAKDEIDKDYLIDSADKLFRTSPDKCAKIIVKAIKDNKQRLLVGPDAKYLDTMTRLLPLSMVRAVAYFISKA